MSNGPTNYSIYIINKGATTQTFWSFLQEPDALPSDPEVFANSSASLAVAPNYGGQNKFVIPLQYSVGAGASNKAVGLNTKIVSEISADTALGQTWLAAYMNAPPKQGPDLTESSGTVPATAIQLNSNPFNKVSNEDQQWYSNMSFGIQTEDGYMGMTWSPSPNDKRTITPKFEFYITTGSFGANQLADWTDVNRNACNIALSDFSQLAVTVTLEQDGTWTKTPGAPTQQMLEGSIDELIASHRYLSEAHARLVEVATEGQVDGGLSLLSPPGNSQEEFVTSVEFDEAAAASYGANQCVLSGTLTVGTALSAAFAVFFLNGVEFEATTEAGSNRVSFRYSGEGSAGAIINMLKAGARLFFSNY